MDERNAGRNSSRIEALPIVVFDQFRCAANAHRRVSVRRTHAGQKQVKLTGTCQVDFDAARTRLLDSNSDTLALLPTNGIRSLGVNPACSFSLDDHDREGLALFAENAERLGKNRKGRDILHQAIAHPGDFICTNILHWVFSFASTGDAADPTLVLLTSIRAIQAK